MGAHANGFIRYETLVTDEPSLTLKKSYKVGL